MGGRGSGGGRGGGGISKQPEVSTQSFNDYVKNKLADLSDADLKKQLTNSKNAMVPLATVNTRNILFICGGAFPDLEIGFQNGIVSVVLCPYYKKGSSVPLYPQCR